MPTHPTYKVILSDTLGDSWEKRFVVVDAETGKILDDAQGYGYKSAQKAHAAYSYKTRDKSKDREKKARVNKIKAWMKDHKDFVDAMDIYAFEIAKGSWGPDEKFNTKFVKEMLEQNDLHPEFSAYELLQVWQKN